MKWSLILLNVYGLCGMAEHMASEKEKVDSFFCLIAHSHSGIYFQGARTNFRHYAVKRLRPSGLSIYNETTLVNSTSTSVNSTDEYEVTQQVSLKL
jgi:hypothetical protein